MNNVIPIGENGYRELNGLAERLRTQIATVANLNPDLAGYIIITVGPDGGWAISWKADPESPIGNTMLAGIGIAAIHRDMLADAAACEALVRNGLKQPPPDSA